MIIKGSRESLTKTAAELMYTVTSETLAVKHQAVLAVPGGRSVAAIFRAFAAYELPWRHIHIFLLDERLVPPDHPQSNFRLLKEELGEIRPETSLYPFPYNSKHPASGVPRYDQELQRVGGCFDLVLVSSGEDGHIGSLFPHHPSISAVQKGYIVVTQAPKPPPERMSASSTLIRQSGAGILLFLGEGKGDALRKCCDTQLANEACPAKIITELNRYYILTDQEVETS